MKSLSSNNVAVAERAGAVSKPRVLIVGGGFAGLNAAKALADADVSITLVDRRNHHTFQPLLYQVALAMLGPDDIAQPLRTILRSPNTEVVLGEVAGIDVNRRCAYFKHRADLEYDYLILATGCTHSYFGKEQWAVSAPGLKTIEDAIEIRRRVLLAFEKAENESLETGQQKNVTFVIIGGGPTGVELAGTISNLSRLFLGNEFKHIDPKSTQVIILEGSPTILAAYPKDLQESAQRQLKKLGVIVRTKQTVTDVQPGYVKVGDERIEASVTLWSAGVQASPLGKTLGFELDKKGLVVVDDRLHPAGHPEIFICGDLAHVTTDGPAIPGVAQPAMQMGTYAGKSIKLEVSGKHMVKPFHYFDKGDIATIGRSAAVTNLKWPFKAHLSGFPAWVTWLGVHILFLNGMRNRFSVFRNWVWTYLFSKDGMRLITGREETTTASSQALASDQTQAAQVFTVSAR